MSDSARTVAYKVLSTAFKETFAQNTDLIKKVLTEFKGVTIEEEAITDEMIAYILSQGTETFIGYIVSMDTCAGLESGGPYEEMYDLMEKLKSL